MSREGSTIKGLIRIIASCCLILGTTISQAANITVMNANDSGGGSLRQAIDSANNNGSADTILFASGLSGQTITLSSQINITDTAALTIDGAGLSASIIISGNNASRVFEVTENQKLTLKQLIITEGKTSTDDADGGAIRAAGALTLSDSIVKKSRTTGEGADGGGFYAGGAVTLINSTILENYTIGAGADGGGFAVGSFSSPYPDLIMSNSLVFGNYTEGDTSDGGGFLVGGDVTISNSIIAKNSTRISGGTLARGGGFSAKGDAMLSNTTVSENSTAGFFSLGGGFFSQGSVMLSNTTISGNTTAGSAANGGGFYANKDITVNNSTITKNRAMHAISNGDGMVVSTVNDLRIVALNSTILADNGTDNFAFVINVGGTVTLNAEHSLFGDVGEINNVDPTNIVSNMPGLAGLADNGCFIKAGAPSHAECVKTHAYLADSAGINVGAANGLTGDQRGIAFDRVVGGQADIGAFETDARYIEGDCTHNFALDIADVICIIDKVLNQ